MKGFMKRSVEIFNIGNYNDGYGNVGSCNLGNYNCDYGNTGNYNCGYSNKGDRNTGNYNIGNGNSGSFNQGNYNSGDWNKCDFSSGVLNTIDGSSGMFNKPPVWTLKEWRESEAYKVMYSLHDEDVLVTERNIWYHSLSSYFKNIIKSLPNFDAEIFKEITGIDVLNE